ncbi:MAG TPA: ATP-binding protein [Verrucomicrobiae bacterium]|jgi:heavy metal sensor kinase
MNPRSIQFRLVAWYTGLLTGIFVLLFTLLFLRLQIFLVNDLRETQLRRAHQVANTLLVRVGETGEPFVAGQVNEWYSPEINDRFVRITRAHGTLIYASRRPHDGSFDPAEVPVLSPVPTREVSREIKLSNGKTLLVAALPFKSPESSAVYIIEFGELLDPVQAMLRHLFLQLAEGLPLAVIIIAVGGYWLVRRALMPVAQITRAAESITQHNLSERLPVPHTGDELERLSISLNRMIARLDDAFQNSKRFVADASHELRTPMTILRGELEALTENKQLDAAVREQAGSMLEEVARLSKIVQQLFALSRLDAGEAQTEWARFDLAELAQTTAGQMNLLAEDKKIAIQCATSQPVFIEGDRARLKQVVVNLLDNAIKYTPPHGQIHLRVRSENERALLEVEDNGIGIPREALPHVFERFFRVDPARTGEAESAGLGLSIVKSICTAHGAEVEAVSVPQTGSCFRVKFSMPGK